MSYKHMECSIWIGDLAWRHQYI